MHHWCVRLDSIGRRRWRHLVSIPFNIPIQPAHPTAINKNRSHIHNVLYIAAARTSSAAGITISRNYSATPDRQLFIELPLICFVWFITSSSSTTSVQFIFPPSLPPSPLSTPSDSHRWLILIGRRSRRQRQSAPGGQSLKQAHRSNLP